MAEEKEIPKDPGRRAFVKGIIGGVIAASPLAGLVGAVYHTSKTKREQKENISLEKTSDEEPKTGIHEQEKTEMPHPKRFVKETSIHEIRNYPDQGKDLREREMNGTLNKILALSLGNEERSSLETAYEEKAQTLPEIDRGLMVIVEHEARGKLVDRRFSLRESGRQELTKLDERVISWAKEQGVHPETLGICMDAYLKAHQIIEVLKSNLRDDLKDNPELLASLRAEDIMINAGGMAALVAIETSSFVDIGEAPAIKQINPEVFPNDAEALKILCGRISKDTGLRFDPENVPGSKRGDSAENLSGGAIGLQFMPSKALIIYELFEKYNLGRFNPFDPKSAVLGAWVFLAWHENLQQGARYGYLRGDQEKMLKALMKWNNSRASATKILEAASDYWDKFIH